MSKIRMRPFSVDLVKPGDIIADDDLQMAKVMFIDRSGRDSVVFSCCDTDGLPARMSWAKDKPILVVTDDRVYRQQA